MKKSRKTFFSLARGSIRHYISSSFFVSLCVYVRVILCQLLLLLMFFRQLFLRCLCCTFSSLQRTLATTSVGTVSLSVAPTLLSLEAFCLTAFLCCSFPSRRSDVRNEHKKGQKWKGEKKKKNCFMTTNWNYFRF